MPRREDILVPARFLLTIGHLVVVLLAASSQPPNVAAGLPGSATPAQRAALAASLQAALGISIVALAVQLFGLLFGFTLMNARLNTVHCLFNFVGGVLTAWYIIDMWTAQSYWAICVIFAMLPGAAEVLCIDRSRRQMMR
jgi:hypothetical protein